MMRVLLVDDEPLVLVGMQNMIDWQALGFELAGTARNGRDALVKVRETRPEIVISDIRMPVMDGLALAAECRRDDPVLPVFIMLTSFEEFDYVRRSMGVGAVEYLIKLELSPKTLTEALGRARQAVEKEQALRTPAGGPTGSLEDYRDRFFLQLLSGMFGSEEQIRTAAKELELTLDAPYYTVAIASIRNRALDHEQQVTLSAGVTRMAADILPRYRRGFVAGMDLRHFCVLLPLQDPSCEEDALHTTLCKVSEILYKYFSAELWWSVGRPVESLLAVGQSHRTAFSALPLLSAQQPIRFYGAQGQAGADHHAKLVADVQDYIRRHLDKRLSLNEVAAVFNFSPGYLSQLFSQNSEMSFVEFVTETRISAAKELMLGSDLKIYEISEKLGFESPFYFSKVFKKLEGVSPRSYLKKLRGAAESEEDPDDDDRKDPDAAD